MCPLSLELCGIALVRFLLAILQTGAFVVFQEPMLGAEMASAEATVSHDPLGSGSALLECATRLDRHVCDGLIRGVVKR